MKVVILAGGYGTRISEETGTIPKPLVEIGSMPILWHIMKIYSAHGLNDFVIDRVKGDRFINLSPFTLDTQPVPYEIDILPGCKVSFF